MSHDGQYVGVGIGNEWYAIPIADIHEIIKMQPMTPIPNSSPFILGVINLRGKIVPVVSLRYRFGLDEPVVGKSARIIVVKHREEMVGVVVDRVRHVTTFDDIQPPPDRIGGASGSLFSGIGRDRDGNLFSLLEIHQVLDA